MAGDHEPGIGKFALDHRAIENDAILIGLVGPACFQFPSLEGFIIAVHP
jgi:hypothetical protein